MTREEVAPVILSASRSTDIPGKCGYPPSVSHLPGK